MIVRLARGPGLGVLLVHRLAHGGQATAEHLLGDRALLGGQRGQHLVAVHALRLQALRPRRGLGRSRDELRSRRPGGRRLVRSRSRAGRRGRLGARARRSLGAGGRGALRRCGRARRPAPALTVAPAVTAPAVVASGPSVVAAIALGREARRHGRCLAGRADDLEPLGLGAGCLGRHHRGDDDAVDLELRLGPHDVADPGALVEERRVEHALGLLGAGRPPRPCAVVTRARQLDVDATCHPRSNLASSSGRRAVAGRRADACAARCERP